MSAAARTIEFKLDLVWKVVILGAFALAARLSWQAWEDTQATLRMVVEKLGNHETRITVVEDRIGVGGKRGER